MIPSAGNNNSRARLFVFILAMVLCLKAASQEDITISWNYGGLTFKEFAAKARVQNNLRFFYRDEWVKDIRTGSFNGPVSLSELLNGLLPEKSLYFFNDGKGNIIITRNFAIKVPGRNDTKDRKYLAPTEIYESHDKGQISGNVFFDVGDPADKDKPGTVTLSGYIINKDTKEPVAGVTVYEKKMLSGTMSNQYGFYSLPLARGSHVLQFSFVGMKEKNVGVNLYGTGDLNIEMTSVLIPLKETVVSAQKSVTLQRSEVGLEKINITSFKLMPTALGETDIIKNVLLLPGVQTVGEGSSGYNVRGGSADQNLVLLYGAPVYNTSHLFGFFSVVNSDIIRDATLYKGGIPGRYGGRISSVLDIASRDGNKSKFQGNAGVSPVTTHLMLEGPIKKDTISYLLTARTTYSNWVLRMIDDPSLKNSKAAFYDVNARISWDINKKNKVDLSGYYSHDSFRLNSDTTYSYNNAIVSGRWRHFFNSHFFSVITLSNSSYNYDISSTKVESEGFNLEHKINTTGLRADVNYYQGRHEFNFGAEMSYHTVVPGKFSPKGDSSLVVTDAIRSERALEGALYAEDKIALTEKLSATAGLRLSSFLVMGPASVMIYDKSFPKSITTIIDTINYGKNRIYKTYLGPEYRLSLNYKAADNISVKVNYNRTRQYLHLLSNSASISPTDTWKLSDYYIKPEIGDQFAVGVYDVLSRLGMEASAEVYYKTIANMVDFKGGTNLVMDKNIEKDLVAARGKAYGLELMLRKTEGKFQGSISYTYSRSFLKSTGSFSDEIINSGKWFPSNYDKPNNLVLVFNYLLSRRLSFAANYTYSTGRPITYPVSIYVIDDLQLTYYSDRNRYRLPDYSRLDVSVKYSGNLRSHRLMHPNWIFSVYNLLGRENVYSVFFRNEQNVINGYKLSVFGQAIPTITFNFDF
ncbi:MAG TPA: TonB-dependent receptor [Bacteroidales bacterium]|nr:TonB-dependent receptor [Bacteroidales bacterium]